eukprot:TRINITY_DN24094_c0_g4_i1.p1 TRINITY_DN24094_c0_g4~~TRINITY_DN24094_c0_g4_i1.p1  ORF type:complete len:796 (-),score=64.64 TRINITY_DN24094_c0_g4_i1:174-2561(-)
MGKGTSLAAALVWQYGLSAGRIVINEVAPTGAPLDTCEFVELINDGSETVDLTGYGLSDNLGNPWYYSQGLVFGSHGCPSPVLAPGERLLLCRHDECSYRFSVRVDDTVILYDPTKNIIDRTSVFAGKANTTGLFHLTWARIPDRSGFFQVSGRATPGTENSVCMWPNYCEDCHPASYSSSAKRCICAPGYKRVSRLPPLACSPCEPGRFIDSNDTDFESCLTCRDGFISAQGSSRCEPCPLGAFSVGRTHCEPCPEFSTTFVDGASRRDDCVCIVGYYARSKKASAIDCWPCGWGRTSLIGAVSSYDCIPDWPFLAPYLIVVFVVLPTVATAYMCHSRQRSRKRAAEIKAKLSQGVASISQIRHPMCLISLPCFLELTLADMGHCHEGARDAGRIVFLDTPKNIKRFQALDRKILFFSYTWMSWETLGPDALQLECMKEAAQRLCGEWGHDPELFYIWLDVLSIPQATEDCKVLAIDSLFMYASLADALVVVCPPSYHQQTGECCGVEQYQKRTWCRVEQMAHFCSHGSASMYMTPRPGELVQLGHDWIEQAVYIFEGYATCCRLGHADGKRCDKELIVPTALAMYANLLFKVTHADLPHTSIESIWDLIRSNLDRVFPRQFDYTNAAGKTRRRELFGSTIRWVDEEMSHADSQSLELISSDGAMSAAPSITTMKRVQTRGVFAESSLSQELRKNLQKSNPALQDYEHDDSLAPSPMGPLAFLSPHQARRHSFTADSTELKTVACFVPPIAGDLCGDDLHAMKLVAATTSWEAAADDAFHAVLPEGKPSQPCRM